MLPLSENVVLGEAGTIGQVCCAETMPSRPVLTSLGNIVAALKLSWKCRRFWNPVEVPWWFDTDPRVMGFLASRFVPETLFPIQCLQGPISHPDNYSSG